MDVMSDNQSSSNESSAISSSALDSRPRWIPDEEQNVCMICSSGFSFITRRHHCRACGKVCCSKCTDYRINLAYLGYIGEQRVCSICFEDRIDVNNIADTEHTTTTLIIRKDIMNLINEINKTNDTYHFRLSENRLSWSKDATDEKRNKEHGFIILDDILVVKPLAQLDLVIHSYPLVGENIREASKVHLRCTSKESRDDWISELELKMKPTLPIARDKGNHVLILINPVSGLKRAQFIWKDVEAMFRLLPLEITIRCTEHAGHAKELATKMNYSRFQAIVCIGGDGLIHQVINGLMSRDDWTEAIKTPIGVIAAGTSNALAAQLKGLNSTTAAFQILRGNTRKLDLLKICQKESNCFSFLNVQWGFSSDIGGQNSWSALFRIAYFTAYSGTVQYVPADNNTFAFCTFNDSCEHCGAESKNSESDLDRFESAQNENEKVVNSVVPQWEEITGNFITIVGCNLQHISHDVRAAPYAHFSDGLIDLIIVKDNCTRAQFYNLTSSLMSGEFVNHAEFNLGSFVHYLKVKAFRLRPTCLSSCFTYDGELAKSHEEITVFNIGAVATICG